jgi:hypothetical protein
MSGLLTDSMFGFNALSLIGFVAMGLGLTFRRMHTAGTLVCFGLMSVGTVLVLLGLYLGHMPD